MTYYSQRWKKKISDHSSHPSNLPHSIHNEDDARTLIQRRKISRSEARPHPCDAFMLADTTQFYDQRNGSDIPTDATPSRYIIQERKKESITRLLPRPQSFHRCCGPIIYALRDLVTGRIGLDPVAVAEPFNPPLLLLR